MRLIIKGMFFITKTIDEVKEIAKKLFNAIPEIKEYNNTGIELYPNQKEICVI